MRARKNNVPFPIITNNPSPMNTDIHSKPPTNPLPGAATDAVKNVQNAAKDMYQTMSSKVDESMVRAKEYAQNAVDATKDATHSASDAAKDMYDSVSDKTENTLVRSKEYVRENPLPAVIGALALGAAIGYLIVASRREPTFQERYADAVGSLSDQMGRVGSNLKFW